MKALIFATAHILYVYGLYALDKDVMASEIKSTIRNWKNRLDDGQTLDELAEDIAWSESMEDKYLYMAEGLIVGLGLNVEDII